MAGPDCLRVEAAANLPGEPENAVDGDGKTAFNAAVGVAVGVFAKDSGNDANAEQDESEAYEPLAPVVKALGQAKVELEDGYAEDGDGEGVAEGVGDAEAQTAAPVALYGGDVRDGREVIVVEAVAQAQQEAGAERGIEFPVARELYHEFEYNAYALRAEWRWSQTLFLFGWGELDLVIGVIDGYDGAAKERAIRFGVGVSGHGVAVDVFVKAHHVGGAGEDGGAFGCDAVDLDDRIVARVDPNGSVDHIGGLALRDYGHSNAVATIDTLGDAGLELHLVVGGGEPGVFDVAGDVDVLFIVEQGIQANPLYELRAALREDNVTLAVALLIGCFHLPLSDRMSFVFAPVDGIGFGERKAQNIVIAGESRGVDAADDGCLVRLLGRERSDCEHGHAKCGQQ